MESPPRHGRHGGGAFPAVRPIDIGEETYQHQPLDDEVQQIRLLRYLGDTFSPQGWPILSFAVETTSLLAEPVRPYYAISYAWGEPDQWAVIALDGIPVKVPRTADEALRGVLMGHHNAACLKADYPFWIDAICIQQHHLPEKAKQVAMMRYIYPLAEAVLVWLGADDGATAAGFETATLLAKDYSECVKQREASNNFSEYFDDCPPPEGADWTAFDTLLRSRWFTRLWILQEVVYAKSVKCFRGRHFLPWGVLSEAVGWAYRQSFHLYLRSFSTYTSDYGQIGLMFVDLLFDMSDRTLNHDTFDELLVLNFGFRTSNAFDRIYSLLGLRGYRLAADLHPEERIVPDYEKSLADVYAQAMYLGIISSQSLRHLSFVPVRRSRASSWPSWVPQFNQLDLDDWSLLVAKRYTGTRYMACSDVPMTARRSADGKLLIVKGVRIGEIASVFCLSPIKDGMPYAEDTIAALYRGLAKAWFLEPLTAEVRKQAKEELETLAAIIKGPRSWKMQMFEYELVVRDFASFVFDVVAHCPELSGSEEAKRLLADAGAHDGNSLHFVWWLESMIC
ncbi:hypothetical protein M409DRAFT_24027 [Zasmidium cellare ATCC 36951]|uniref:Heterokaryon incompatibility domain-containing protein n=1 Tax=Zasmidium cellare ATCC 36951 TaxID=1080233 RepID=A0A6A6CJ62_ZASCE|nr:uncharacterized protein M409DRAFT_24027 [Zasmidium cellare ATCC 36951]KAF2165739.1 hypothetical protein M409DRAFT_24027 [Zasmidium cellare ATCC 36951]